MTQSFKVHDDIPDDVNQISKQILDVCFIIHTDLGPGLLESIYEEAVYSFLIDRGLKVERQKSCEIYLQGKKLDTSMRFDLVVEEKIILELKSVEKLLPIHTAQMHSYLKISGCPLGLLINFNVTSLKNGIKRTAMTKNNQTLRNSA